MRKESKGKQHMSKQRKYNRNWPSAQADSPAAKPSARQQSASVTVSFSPLWMQSYCHWD